MDNTLCGRFYAMIFYSFADPAQIRDPLMDSLHSLIELADVEFTRQSLDGERYRAGGRYLSHISKTIASADFARSQFLRLHDGSDDAVQNATVEYWLRTIHPEFKSKTPNYIYVELSVDADRDTMWNTFRQIFECGCFCFAMGNHVITGHHEKHPQSGALAARELRKAEDDSVGFWEIFGNQSLRAQLSPEKLFYGPSEFAAVSNQFAGMVVKTAANDVGAESTATAHYFRATSTRSRADLWRHLRSVRLTVERPWMYWKDDNWKQWFQHVSFESAT